MKHLAWILAGLCALHVAAARAEDGWATFVIRSTAYYSVHVKFVSQDRDAQWPGSSTNWPIHDHQSHRFKLNCQVGENICFGAFYQNLAKKWGVGLGHDECHGCCLVCQPREMNVEHSWTLNE
jgi:hypothetical protein